MVLIESFAFNSEDAARAVASTSPVAGATVYDSEFIENLRRGDAESFDLLIERYSPDVYALIFRLTSDAAETADIAQETFFKAFRSITGFRGDSSLKTWLFRIAINESRNRFRWWRRRHRGQTRSLDETIGESETALSDMISDSSISPEDEAYNRERRSALLSSLAAIKPAFREVVVLVDIEGLTYEECAAATGQNVGTVKSRLSRGREALRKRMTDF